MLMQIFKKIRDLKGWSKYKMAKSLRITQTQLNHYENQPVSTREMILIKLQEESGLSVDEFWQLLSREVKPADKNRIRKRLEN